MERKNEKLKLKYKMKNWYKIENLKKKIKIKWKKKRSIK